MTSDNPSSEDRRPLRLGVLLSGGGTTMLNIAEHIRRGELAAEIAIVISSRPDAKGVERAEAAMARAHAAKGEAEEILEAAKAEGEAVTAAKDEAVGVAEEVRQQIANANAAKAAAQKAAQAAKAEAEKLQAAVAQAQKALQAAKAEAEKALAARSAAEKAMQAAKGDAEKALAAKQSAEKAVMTVKDEGAGFDFSRIPDPTHRDNMEKPNGRGVFLIKQLMNRVEFFNGGSGIKMIKFLES